MQFVLTGCEIVDRGLFRYNARLFMAHAAVAMDDDVKNLLRQILIVQQEQAAILKRYLPPLWTRIRFTLFGLFVVRGVVAIGMGLVVSGWNSSRGIPAVRPSLTPPLILMYRPPPSAPPIRV